MGRRSAALTACMLVGLLTGCVSTGSRDGSVRESTGGGYLAGVSALHSEMNLRLKLMMAGREDACKDKNCIARQRFEQRVQQIGGRLSQTAMTRFPELKSRFEQFNFSVSDSNEIGVASSDAGNVVVLGGTQRLELDDPALAFVLAREMAHVIVGHHESNTMTSLLISLAAQIVTPVFNVARGAAAAVAGRSAMTSAAAMAGSKALVSSQRPDQLQEAEAMGLELVSDAGYGVMVAVRALQARLGTSYGVTRFPDEWSTELKNSIPRVSRLAADGLANSFSSPSQLAAIAQDVSGTQALIARGADPTQVTQASAARNGSETLKVYAAELLAEETARTTPSQPAVFRVQKPAALQRKAGHWGPGGYSEPQRDGDQPTGRTHLPAETAELAAPTPQPAAQAPGKAASGYWGPWGYSERTVTEAGESGVIVKTVSADQLAPAEKLQRATAPPKKDRLVPQGYWGTWGYGP